MTHAGETCLDESSDTTARNGDDTHLAGPPDRRSARRHVTIDQHGIVSARVRPGHEVLLVDVSAGGALIETSHRLLPGCSIELQLATCERRLALRGCVLRCSVARLSRGLVCYRGAIGFERSLSWFGDGPAEGV